MRLSATQVCTGLLTISLLATIATFYRLGSLNPHTLQTHIDQAGMAAPLLYVAIYVVSTLFIFPSSALNLAGGALFGLWGGTLWTSLGAILAAIVAFWCSRTLGRSILQPRLGPRWHHLDQELRQGGLFYMCALRMLPLLPYGLVNWVAGLTSMRFRDYLIGTTLGTVPGIVPFVWLGQAGVDALQTETLVPIILPLLGIGLSIAAATWYRRHRAES